MKKFKVFFIIVGLALFLFGCGSNKTVNFEIEMNEEMVVGEEQELKLIGDIDASAATWTVEDDSVLSIEDGKIVALDEGFVSIYAEYEGVVKETSINVSKVRKMKYELNGGTCDELKTEFSSGKTYVLPTPTKEGFIFLGWYSNKSFSGDPITELNNKNSSIQTLYASWRSEQFTITYCLNKDGKEELSEEFSLFKEDFTLKTVELSSEYVFSGWYEDSNLTKEIQKVEAGYKDDIKVYGYIVKKTNDIKVTLNTNGGTITGDVIKYVKPGEIDIEAPTRDKYNFVGWCKDYALTVDATGVYKDCYLYAKWAEVTPVQNVTITNTKVDVERRGELQITYALNPNNPSVSDVVYNVQDKTILSIDKDGLITGLKVGKTMVTVTSKSESGAKASIEIEVYEPNFFEVSYDTNSYVKVGETIKLNAKYHLRGQNDVKLTWSSLDTSVATVKDGVVTGVKDGYAKIRVSYNEASFDFGVTVYSDSSSEVLKYIIDANNSNIFVREHLGIGAGSPVYYMDIIGSVSKLLYNWDYEVNRKWEQTQAGINSNHGGTKESTEFICVHYTGNMSPGADANANASYFANGGGGTSIHYTTGNDGIYSCLDDNLVGFHAGDKTDVRFEWYPTGVMYKEGDPTYPVWGITSDSMFTINGQKTTIKVPTGTTAATEKVTGDTFEADGRTQKCINNLGLPFKIENGEYYMGTTWWCYSQIGAGRICSKGGNNNSVGIESCVNEGSDLWYTWQITAQLVAHLMETFNLDITRVWGHHFYSAKDCPQPMLENDNEIWWEFIELVKAEHERITTYKDYSFAMEIVDGNNFINNKGRVSEDNEYHTVTYKVTITNNKTKATESVTLSSIVEGMYIR